MSTQVQDVINSAVALSVMNQSLATNIPDLIYRINQSQRTSWTKFVATNRYFYQTTASVTSTSGSGSRTADLSGFTLPVERLLTVSLPSGTEVYQVDLQDLNAELAPRYYPDGSTLVEVGTDWNTASTAAVTLSVKYCYRPADLDPSGATTQLVSLPDGYTGVLVHDLGAYFAASDVGRDPAEAQYNIQKRDETLASWIEYGQHYAGTSSYRLAIPVPSVGGGKR